MSSSPPTPPIPPHVIPSKIEEEFLAMIAEAFQDWKTLDYYSYTNSGFLYEEPCYDDQIDDPDCECGFFRKVWASIARVYRTYNLKRLNLP
jgi:hypothetical protein